jgi:membrane associated rhomboid family serine protease
MLFHASYTVPVIGGLGGRGRGHGALFPVFPHARVVTLIPILIIPFITELPHVFLGIWFLIQLFSGCSTPSGTSKAPRWPFSPLWADSWSDTCS